MIFTVDSKQKKLSMQEVMVRAMYSLKDRMPTPVDQALLLLMEELQMPNSEAIQFGNTVFVTHYSPESDTCVMYALNVDTANNLVKNGELYTRHLINKGMKGFVTSYDTKAFSIPFKHIEKNHLGTVETWEHNKKFMTAVMFNPKKQAQRNA